MAVAVAGDGGCGWWGSSAVRHRHRLWGDVRSPLGARVERHERFVRVDAVDAVEHPARGRLIGWRVLGGDVRIP